MPIMGGIEASQGMRKQELQLRFRTPIIGLSGYSRKSIEQSAQDAGMDAYMTKPYMKDELYALILKYTTLSPSTINQEQKTFTPLSDSYRQTLSENANNEQDDRSKQSSLKVTGIADV